MLLRMIELETYPIDEVITLDTGLEFPALYFHIDKVRKYVESKGIKFTVLRSEHTFEELAFERIYKTRFGELRKGYGFPRINARWCTGVLKYKVYRKYIKEHYKGVELYTYIGIAADESYRLERKMNQDPFNVYPLVEWGWSEAEALEYCYEKGYDFGGLYKSFSRVSCWCCPLQSLSEAKKLYFNFPELWQKLKDWEHRSDMTFKQGYTIEMLEARFNLEREREDKGLTINPHTKEFRAVLKETLSHYTPPQRQK